jgi:hypothetical protein
MVSPSKKRAQRNLRVSKWTSGISWVFCLFTIAVVIIINSAGISVNRNNINGESYSIVSVSYSTIPDAKSFF